MIEPKVIYLVVSGSSMVREVPALIEALTKLDLPLYTLLTENARRVISPRELAGLPDHKFVDSYFDPSMFFERQPGLILVAPATFNTVNKISQGIADTLSHSLIAEAIGADWPVVIAPAANVPLSRHPRFQESLQTLTGWGLTLVPQRTLGNKLYMATVADIVAAVKTVLNEEKSS